MEDHLESRWFSVCLALTKKIDKYLFGMKKSTFINHQFMLNWKYERQ